MGNPAGPGVSFRLLSILTSLFLGALVTGLAIGLTFTTRRVQAAAERAEKDTTSVFLCAELERTFREYHRVANLGVATRDPSLAGVSAGLKASLQHLVLGLGEHVGGPDESRLLSQLASDLGAYLAEREAIEARTLSLEEVVKGIRPALEQTLASIARVHAANQEDFRTARQEVREALDFEVLLALGSVLILALSLAIVLLGIRRLVLRPVIEVKEAMRRFREGDGDATAHGGLAHEFRELASTFNYLRETLLHHRRDQLIFLAGVAHDLRNPLTTLKLAVRAGQEHAATCTPEWFRLFDRQIDRLTRLVGDLLDATRIEAGELELRLVEMDLREVARAVIDLYAPTTPSHEVRLHVPEEPVRIQGDPARIEQVLSNLVSNAIKYSPGGGSVQVAVTVDGTDAVAAISDRGPGIPRQEIENIFLPFRRMRSTADSLPGAGLGLSIVRRLVTAHGGLIEVESIPGLGSTFRVRFPLLVTGSRRRSDEIPSEPKVTGPARGE